MKNALLLIFASLLISFVALEGAFRLYGRYLDHCGSELQGKNFDSHSFMKLTKPTINPHGGFILCKRFSGKFQGKIFSTNLYGARGVEFLPVKDSNTKRIVGIGDSVMMGWGVGDDETFMALLNQDKDYEAINLGVAGLNAIQEYFHLRDRAMPLKPDILILSYVGNDWEGENSSRDWWTFTSPSFFINWVFHRVTGDTNADFRETKGNLTSRPGDALAAYKAMGWLLKKEKIPCLVVLDSRYESPFVSHQNMEKLVSREMGCEVLNLMKEMRGIETMSVEESTSIGDRHNKELIIQGDGHPNEKWHAEVAKLVLDKIKSLH